MTSEQKEQLFFDQKTLLDTFLVHGAISRSQYLKSLDGLIQKMHMTSQPSAGEQLKQLIHEKDLEK